MAQRDFSELKSDILNAETELKRLEGIITLGSIYSRTQIDSIYIFADSLASPTFDNQELARAGRQFLEAIAAYHQGRLNEAIEKFELSQSYFEATGRKSLQLRCLNFLGIAYTRTNEVEQAINIQNNIIDLAGDDPEYLEAKRAAYGNQANAYRRLGEYARAIYNLEKTLELSNGDTVGPIGMSYLGMGQMLTSLRLYERSLEAYRNINLNKFPSESVKGAVYSGMAVNYLNLENLDSAYYNFNKAYEITNNSGNWQQVLRPQLEMAKIAVSKENIELAQKHIEIAEALKNEYSFAPPAYVDLYLAKIRFSMLLEDFETAKILATDFEAFVNDNSIVHLSKNGFRIISDLYEKLGDTETALKFQKLHNDLELATVTVSNNSRIAEQRSQLALLEKDEIIQQESAQKAFYQGLTFQIVAVTLLFIVISAFLYKYYRKEKSENVIKDNQLKDLKQKLNELHQKSSKPQTIEHITLKSKALIKLEDLDYVSSDGPYLEFHLKTKDNPEIDRNSLKNILDELPSKKFIQVHRSHIVNLDSVRSIYSNKVVLNNGNELSVSRSFKDKLDLLLHNN